MGVDVFRVLQFTIKLSKGLLYSLPISGLTGTRYMIVDCGGGTVDITVHEMDAKSGKLHEIYKATGGPYGSVGES